MIIHKNKYLHILDIEDGVLGVHGSLVLGGLTDKTLLVGERDEGRGGEASLLVGNCKSSIVNQPNPQENSAFVDNRIVGQNVLISTLAPS
jgi:hypothetical protein